jgi:hypothetical protein
MKRFLLILLGLSAASLLAQEEHLIGDKIESGGFGGPVWKATRLNGETAFLSGGRGGWIINHAFVIGGGGYGTLADVRTNLTGAGGKRLYLRMEYGGLELEYIRHSAKLVHWTVQSLFGTGRVLLKEHDPEFENASDRIGVVDAGLNLEMNVVKWMRVNAGAGYRLVFGVDTDGLNEGDLGGGCVQVTLKFGGF